MQRFDEEAFGGLGIPRRAQEELERVAFRVDGSIQIHPGFAHFDVRFVDPPRVIGGFEMWPAAFLQFGGIVLHPARDRGVVNPQPAFEHHFLQISVTERVLQVPAHAQQNDL